MDATTTHPTAGGPRASPPQGALAQWVALAVVALSILPGLGAHALHDPDEGRYGEIAREMRESGDLVSPRLDGILYFEKPPLFFWLAAAAIRLLGATETAARLPSAVAGIACALVVMRMGARVFGREVGVAAGLLLATTPMFAFAARTALVDMVLCALITGALAACVEAVLRPRGEARGPALAFWAITGLGFLCKGPIAVAIPVAWAGVYTVAARDMGLVRALADPLGIAAFLAIASPWYLAMESRNPGYLKAFFLDQNLHRLMDGDRFKRDRPLWYYVPVVMGLLLPWSLLLPFHAREAYARVRDLLRGAVVEPGDRARALLASAVVGPLILLSVAHSKLVYYALPVFPPIALLLAQALVGAPDDAGAPATGASVRRPAWTRGLLAIALLSTAFALAATACLAAPDSIREAALRAFAPSQERLEVTSGRLDIALRLAWPVAAIALSLAAASALALDLARRARPSLALAPLAATLLLSFALAPWIGRDITEDRSTKRAAAVLRDGLGPDDVVITFQHFFRTLPYYLERPVTLWSAGFTEFGRFASADELKERSLERSDAALAALWRGPRRAVALVTDDEDLVALERVVGIDRVRTLARVGRTSVVDNRPELGTPEGGR